MAPLLSRYALSMGAAAALLAGCGGGSQQTIGVQGAMPQAARVAHPSSRGYRVLHRFKNSIGGRNPSARLIDVNDTLYGTTWDGGSYGFGTVYSISTRGVTSTLYSFRGGSDDGAGPAADLIYVNGTFYGTTAGGGPGPRSKCPSPGGFGVSFYGCGTVFSVTPSGQEKVIYFFQPPPAPATPSSGLIDIHGALYGTTELGGLYECDLGFGGCGAVYSVTTSGKETTRYEFRGSGYSDGQFPYGGDLLDINGTLYGTTEFGGASNDGIVYSMTPKGKETVLYAFHGGSDGKFPTTGLIEVNGTFYGTTYKGGAGGCGTVYSITAQGDEHVIYSFGCGADGAAPIAGLTQIDGLLYGTTASGGTSCAEDHQGCGTVYSLTTSGVEQILHTFRGGRKDGGLPVATLLSVKGTLYGTTSERRGSVFALTP